MTSRRLSDSDKKKILELYRHPGETTSTLASRYGVSNSTISRILKTSLSEAEYETLIQQKRGARSSSEALVEPVAEESAAADSSTSPAIPEPTLEPSPELAAAAQLEIELIAEEIPRPTGGRRSRKRSTADPKPAVDEGVALPSSDLPLNLPPVDLAPTAPVVASVDVDAEPNGSYSPEANALQEMLGEELLDQEELADELEDEDEDEDDLDEDDLDEDDLDEGGLEAGALLVGSRLEGKPWVQVLPLDEAPIPKTCYLVVDRSAELIARPLKEFGDLGQIPQEEVLEKTLPIFDNHRVAKRFSNPRTHRVIKLPDGRVLQKTSSHLQAKGITRLLIDGQVYSLN